MVKVTPTRPGTNAPWAVPGIPHESVACQISKDLGKSEYKVLADLACDWDSPDVGQVRKTRMATAPDLFVRIRANLGLSYRSYTAREVLSHEFGYRVLVPVDAIPAAGLELLVINDDGAGNEQTEEAIGSVRVTKDRILAAATSGSLISLKDGGVERLEVTAAIAGGATSTVSQGVDVSQRPVELPGVGVLAGQVVEIHASGNYTVDGQPAGVLGIKPPLPIRNLRVASLQSAGTGEAIAFIGSHSEVQVLPVGSGVAAVVRNGGGIMVGINDRFLAHDVGKAEFQVTIRNPTAQEWLAGRPAVHPRESLRGGVQP